MRSRQKLSACVHCRQEKLGCDAPKCFPTPCSRCVKRGLNCSIDPSFKRIRRRGRLDAVEQELHDMKQRLGPSSDSNGAWDDSSPSAAGASSHFPNSDIAKSLPTSLFLTDGMSKVLGDVTLNSDTISDLLREYYEHYHGQLPIILGPPALLSSCDADPVLFWTVMMIASKEAPKYKGLYIPLVNAVKSLTSSISSPSEQSLLLIQSLLLLCYWPFPSGALANENLWTFCGLATTYALAQGLHRSHYPSDFLYQAVCNDATVTERRKIWLACYILAQKMSTMYGLPCLVKPDRSILETIASQPSWLPNSMYHQLCIAHQSGKFCNILGNSELSESGLLPNPALFIRMFDDEFREQETHVGSSWRRSDYIYFSVTRLQLYSFALSPSGDELDKSLLQERYKEFLLHGYLTAMSLLQCGLLSVDDLPYWTTHQTRYMVYGTLFLLKILGGSYDFIDEVAARNVIHKMWDLLRSGSHEKDDHLSRSCAVIDYLSRIGWNQSDLASVNVQSRLAANLSVSAIWHARDRFSDAVKAQRPLDYTSAAARESEHSEFDETFLQTLLNDPFSHWESFYLLPGSEQLNMVPT